MPSRGLPSQCAGPFHQEQTRMIAANLCGCAGCVACGKLRLKCVGHVGQVAEQTIREHTKLVGVDVILVHRLLKNAVPVEEYVLLSEELYGTSDNEIRSRASSVDQELEGLGRVRAYFVDLGTTNRAASTPSNARSGHPYRRHDADDSRQRPLSAGPPPFALSNALPPPNGPANRRARCRPFGVGGVSRRASPAPLFTTEAVVETLPSLDWNKAAVPAQTHQ